MEKYANRLFYWKIPQQMIFEDYPVNNIKRKNFDCFWDEMAVEIPSDKWKDTDPAIRKFFAQHRKRGIEIFGNTQDYMMLDINARRMATKVYETHKLVGTRDPSATLPPLKIIWGIIAQWQLDKKCIRVDDMDRRHIGVLPEFISISKKLTSIYDTTEDIDKAEKTKLQHVELECDTCLGRGYPRHKCIKIEHLPI